MSGNIAGLKAWKPASSITTIFGELRTLISLKNKCNFR